MEKEKFSNFLPKYYKQPIQVPPLADNYIPTNQNMTLHKHVCSPLTHIEIPNFLHSKYKP